MTRKKSKANPAEKSAPQTPARGNKNYAAAHDQAEKDIEKDPDLRSKPNPEDDLDEGELARLEGED